MVKRHSLRGLSCIFFRIGFQVKGVSARLFFVVLGLVLLLWNRTKLGCDLDTSRREACVAGQTACRIGPYVFETTMDSIAMTGIVGLILRRLMGSSRPLLLERLREMATRSVWIVAIIAGEIRETSPAAYEGRLCHSTFAHAGGSP